MPATLRPIAQDAPPSAASSVASTRRADGEATLVLIASAGHSGSTLLDLLLANHSQVSSAGEMNRLTLHAPDRVCACGATVTKCEYWNRVREVIAAQQQPGTMIRWDECHTDIPPQRPMLRLEIADEEALLQEGEIAARLRQQLNAAGLHISGSATVARRGVRDFKWSLTDAETAKKYVLRPTEQGLDVYSEDVTWRNPLRMIPQPIELALALGAGPALRIVTALSASASEYRSVAENSWAVADAMSRVGGTPIVVDSSKSPLRLKLLFMLRPERVRVVQLVRDGRAVAASAMRRGGISAQTAARVWKRDNQNLAIMLRSVPDTLKIRVQYENVCEQPQNELERLCSFLGLDFEPRMLTLWQRPVHNIPGNPMLFNRTRHTISKDDRWRRELSAADLETFDRVAGRMNKSFGYQ